MEPIERSTQAKPGGLSEDSKDGRESRRSSAGSATSAGTISLGAVSIHSGTSGISAPDTERAPPVCSSFDCELRGSAAHKNFSDAIDELGLSLPLTEDKVDALSLETFSRLQTLSSAVDREHYLAAEQALLGQSNLANKYMAVSGCKVLGPFETKSAAVKAAWKAAPDYVRGFYITCVGQPDVRKEPLPDPLLIDSRRWESIAPDGIPDLAVFDVKAVDKGGKVVTVKAIYDSGAGDGVYYSVKALIKLCHKDDNSSEPHLLLHDIFPEVCPSCGLSGPNVDCAAVRSVENTALVQRSYLNERVCLVAGAAFCARWWRAGSFTNLDGRISLLNPTECQKVAELLT